MTSLTKEQEILIVMRKVLASIIKDTTPPPGMRHTLTDQTIQDVRNCLGLIAMREKELADEQGRIQAQPYFSDEPQQATVVPIGRIGKKDQPEEE